MDLSVTTPQIAEMLDEGQTAVAEPNIPGANRVIALIDVKLHPQQNVGFDRVAKRIARFVEVRSCSLMSGTYDLAVEVESTNLESVARFVSERLSTLEGVASTTTHFVLKRYKHDGVSLMEETTDERLAITL